MIKNLFYIIRLASPADYPAILALSEANQAGSLSPDERGQGFLSARFSLEQLAVLAKDMGILVACEGERVLGFLCALRLDWGERPPILQSMVAAFGEQRFRGRPLAEQRLFIYGPVCIDRPFRGRGVLRGLFQGLCRELRGRCEVGVAFVSAQNPHSLSAHTSGLGMERVGGFTHGGLDYHTLAFATEEGPGCAPGPSQG